MQESRCIDSGADIDTGVDAWYGSLLQVSINFEDAQIAEYLLKKGANPNQIMNKKYPILWSVKQLALAKKFIECGADIHSVHKGDNILSVNIKCNMPVDLMKLYLEKKVDAAIVDSDKNNLWHHVVNRGNWNAEKARLLRDAIPLLICTQNKDGKRPSDIALDLNRNDIFQVIQGYTEEIIKELTKTVDMLQAKAKEAAEKKEGIY